MKKLFLSVAMLALVGMTMTACKGKQTSDAPATDTTTADTTSTAPKADSTQVADSTAAQKADSSQSTKTAAASNTAKPANDIDAMLDEYAKYNDLTLSTCQMMSEGKYSKARRNRLTKKGDKIYKIRMKLQSMTKKMTKKQRARFNKLESEGNELNNWLMRLDNEREFGM